MPRDSNAARTGMARAAFTGPVNVIPSTRYFPCRSCISSASIMPSPVASMHSRSSRPSSSFREIASACIRNGASSSTSYPLCHRMSPIRVNSKYTATSFLRPTS